jgi:hypothetical protein
MKNVLVFIMFIFARYSAFAQQKGQTSYMNITIYEVYAVQIGHIHNMIITRTDSAQLQTDIDLKMHGKAKDYLAEHEQVIMSALQPYFTDGWKLISTSVEVSNFQGSEFDKTYRYYLSREQ